MQEMINGIFLQYGKSYNGRIQIRAGISWKKYKGKNKENENNGPSYEEMKVKGTGETAQHFRLLRPAGDEFSTHTRGSQPPVPLAPWNLTPPSGPWAQHLYMQFPRTDIYWI